MASKSQIIEINRKNPKLSAREIALRVGCKTEFVRATAYRERLVIPGLTLPDPEKAKRSRPIDATGRHLRAGDMVRRVAPLGSNRLTYEIVEIGSSEALAGFIRVSGAVAFEPAKSFTRAVP